MTIWAGLDLGHYEAHVCVVDDEGAVILDASTTSDPSDIAAVLEPFKTDLEVIALEAGIGTHVARSLIANGFPVVTFEARQASKILAIKRNKTDRNDAFGLAQVGRLARGVISRVHIKSLNLQKIRNCLTLRRQLVRQRKAAESAIKALFSIYGVRLGRLCTASGTRRAIDEKLLEISPEERADFAEDLSPLVDIALNLRDCITRLEKRIQTFAEENAVCRRFLEIPGVGPICAVSFYTAIETAERFNQSSSAAAYLGLTPRIQSSGKRELQPRISKMGNVMTRTNLVLAARALLRSTKQDSYIRTWGLGLKERSNYRKAEIAVARKLAVVMLAIWKNGSHYKNFPSSAETLTVP